jgi:secreted protein with Ig-like and vWFA domain
MGCNGHNGDAVAMAIKKSIDQVQIAGTTTSRAHRELACQLAFSAGRKRCDLLVTDGNPLDLFASAQRLCDAVERIAHQSVNALNVGSLERLNYSVGYIRHFKSSIMRHRQT